MRTIVVKFGGSSLANAGQMKKAAAIVRANPDRHFVVPSAPGKRFSEDTKVTDMLGECYELAGNGEEFEEILWAIRGRYEDIISGLGLVVSLDEEFKEIEQKFLERAGKDYALSRGEYLNGKILAKYLGFRFVDAAQVIRFGEDGGFLAEETNGLLREAFSREDYAVVPGFYGADENGVIHTFSRGGSDITGSLVARGVQADLYENWTDVSGFLVADPHIIDDPQVISMLTYKELRELAYMGAGVLHEDSIFPVRKEGIPINIRNTNRPEDKGTMIVANTCRASEFTITGIAGKKGFAAVNIEKDMMNSEIGFGRRVLEVFERNGISLGHVPSGIDTMSVFVEEEEFLDRQEEIVRQLYQETDADHIEVEPGLGLIAVVGRSMRQQRGTAGRIFTALAHAHVNVRMIDQGSSELNVIIGVDNGDFETAVKAIYDMFVTVQL